ncbi:hypothetical protein MTO96_012343 [Rhipicephalus appendiculatus]
MQCIAVVLATIVIVPVSGDGSCSKPGGCKASACGPTGSARICKSCEQAVCSRMCVPTWLGSAPEDTTEVHQGLQMSSKMPSPL